MASLWDTLTGASRQNASAEQLKREAARQAAEEAAARQAAKEQAEREAAKKRVDDIAFKRGGAVKKTAPVARKVAPAVKRPIAKAKPAVKSKARR